MGPSEHAADLSNFDSLSKSSLHDAEEVIHTASEPCDEQRLLLYPADAVDAVGEAGCSSLASSDHVANSANSDVPLHRSLHELQDNARAIANTHQMLSNEEQDAEACGNPMGAKTVHAHTPERPYTP